MTTEAVEDTYTPAQVSAITGLPLKAVQKAIEYKLIRPKRVREGRLIQRVLSRAQLVYLRMEAKGLKTLPLATRRQVAQVVEREPAIDIMMLAEGSVILVEFKSSRKEVDTGLRRLAQAIRMVESNPEVMNSTPVYKGTRIPVDSVSQMLHDGATIEEILEGYPALTRQKIELAPMYTKAFPRRGRPAARPWAKRESRRFSKHPMRG